MRETYYLCRVPWRDGDSTLVLYAEKDYKYRRHHEESLYVPDSNYNVELLAQGGFVQMHRFKQLMKEET